MTAVKKKPVVSAIVVDDETGHAIVGKSADVMAQIMDMWAPENAVVADLTFGWGNFWTDIPVNLILMQQWGDRGTRVQSHTVITEQASAIATVYASDIGYAWADRPEQQWSGIDARCTPYIDGSLDMAVFDPPFAGTGGTGENGNKASGSPTVSGYGNKVLGSRSSDKILELYWEAMVEIRRITKPDGIAVLKVCDQVEASVNRWLHARLMLQTPGWVCTDLFYLIRKGVGLRHDIQQLHSRKNISHFLVMAKEESKLR